MMKDYVLLQRLQPHFQLPAVVPLSISQDPLHRECILSESAVRRSCMPGRHSRIGLYK